MEDTKLSQKGKITVMGGSMFGMHGFWGMGLIGVIFNLAIIVGIVILIVWAVKRFTSGNPVPGASAQTPREILQSRYARGEITRDQYQQMLSDLT